MRPELFSRSILLNCFLCICSLAACQLSRPGKPLPLNYKDSKPLMVYEIEIPPEVRSGELTEAAHPLLKPAGSGFLADVDFDIYESGIWDTLQEGTKIWRAAFLVSNASAMNIVFNTYRVNKGVKVYLYDYDQQHILGAFTDLNNKATGVLATAQLFSEMLIVEVQVPPFLEHAGQLVVAQIGCDFTGDRETKVLKDGWYGWSGDCNEDINCYDDPGYQRLKYSVVRIVYDGGERCTGALINNTSDNGRNFVITAAHCINRESIANTSVFCFDYESPFCDGPDGNSSMSISGSTIRAKGDRLDFVLLELLEPVPFYYHPYYAGWDVTDNQPLSGVTIHHPQGDVKKIALENHPLTTATFSSEYVENSHWLVHHWESGTTEAGSSGGPFFDQNGRIVGTLTGGQAQCSNPVNDYFQKMISGWDFLSFWLDPAMRLYGFIDGYDPYAEFRMSGDTLSNIMKTEQLVAEKDGLLWGHLSGHNSSYLRQFAEQYRTVDKKTLLGILLNISHNYVASVSGHLVMKVWQGGTIPKEIVFEKDVHLADLVKGEVNLIELDSSVSVVDTFYVGYELFYDIPQDTFAVWMADNRTVQPGNSAFVFDGANWMSLNDYTSGSYNSSFSIMPVVYDHDPVTNPDDDSVAAILVYPNPVSDACWIKFREMTAGPVQVKLYNLSGQLIYQQEFPPYQTLIHLQTGNLPSGIYILKVTGAYGTSSLKLVVYR
ncbi:MAG: T9SS type A sorting domain-containing protein [Bacteroidales bacterium]|nr:T9SS type A sorting domain-containing protein [Bacteroidales bacterium]